MFFQVMFQFRQTLNTFYRILSQINSWHRGGFQDFALQLIFYANKVRMCASVLIWYAG